MHDSILRSPSRPSDKLALQVDPLLGVTIIFPAFNEEVAIATEILRVREALTGSGIKHELLVVDDGSEDETAARALAAGARVLRHFENRGYGASLKTGILAAS